MITKQLITRTAVIFAALTIAGISVAVSAQAIPVAFAQTVMVAVGSAIFGAGLTFFLVRIFALTEK
jgi:hypothetical protein